MLERCQNCGRRVILGLQDPAGVFCSTVCRDSYSKSPGFCETCLGETHEIGVGHRFILNGSGPILYGSGSPCPRCGSVIKRLFWCFCLIPIVPLARFRVKRYADSSYVTRRLRMPGEPYLSFASSAMEDQGYQLLAEATKLETQGRIQEALVAYQQIFDNYPRTSAGQDALRSAESLRARTG